MNLKVVVIVLIAVIGLAVLILAPQSERGPRRVPVVEGLEVPDIVLYDINGNTWRLSDKRGKVVFMNFWASWCKECREEMPSIQVLYDRKKSDPNFDMALIIYNEDPMKSAKYMEENNFTMPIFVDPGGEAAYNYSLTGVPETYIVDRKGVLRKKVIGPSDYGSSDAINFVTNLSGETL